MQMLTKLIPAGLALVVAAQIPPADARTARHHRGLSSHHYSESDGRRGGEAIAANRQNATDDYVKAAAQQEDKLLDSQIKSICRGC